ncbi:uncharacterized protein LOC129566598 [Sitodiplosis mosellana]|uniref:uncharacterized protein LOC129566598 n=1 Tax=Sitodiplosis mosellana TaxID=263140 RepID=UPI002444FB7D|nr:uncharacterized protein LOC129566598 [Sitodiplosis mosellana]
MVESGLSEIPSELIHTTVKEFVEHQLNSKQYTIKCSSASQSGENNFIGIVYRVTFGKDDKTENGTTNQGSKLILKVSPQNLARREQFISRPCFLREIYMYNEVLPFFRQFEESRGVILDDNGFIEYPKCYRTVDKELDECILLEDLSVRGFSIVDRFTEDITADHVRLVMKALGKLHALSFALKDQQPAKFKELTSNLSEHFIRRNEDLMRGYFAKQAESASSVLSEEEHGPIIAKVKKLFETSAIDVAADCLDLEATGSASVIAHGDAWQNNTMFRYDQNGKPIEVSLLDWQVSRQSSPIIDIVYFVFCCTTKELRDAHYDDFLKVYHESLSTHIRKLGSDPEKLFPEKLMQEHFRKFGKFGLVLAAILLPLLTKDSGKEVDLDGIADGIKTGQVDLDTNIFMTDSSTRRFNKRLRDVVIDMARLEYI